MSKSLKPIQSGLFYRTGEQPRCVLFDGNQTGTQCKTVSRVNRRTIFSSDKTTSVNIAIFLSYIYDVYECDHYWYYMCKICNKITSNVGSGHILTNCNRYSSVAKHMFNKEALFITEMDYSRSYRLWSTDLCGILPQLIVLEINYHELFDERFVIRLHENDSIVTHDEICASLISRTDFNVKCIFCKMYYDCFPTSEQCHSHLATECLRHSFAVSP